MSAWIFCGTASHVSLKMEAAAEYPEALIRAYFFLVHLKKASCFSTHTGFKMNLQMLFNATWHNFFLNTTISQLYLDHTWLG